MPDFVKIKKKLEKKEKVWYTLFNLISTKGIYMSFIKKPKSLTFLSIAAAALMSLTGCAGETKETQEIVNTVKSIGRQTHRPLKDRACDGLFTIVKAHEKYKGFVYLCTAGKLTCGYGSNIEDLDRRAQLVFTDSEGRRLSQKEVEARFQAIADAKPRMETGVDNRGRPVYNYKADTYRKFDLFVTRDSAEQLCRKDLGQTFDALKSNFRSAGIDIDKVPFVIVVGSMDIQYNTGNFTKNSWKRCYAGLQVGAKGDPRGYHKAALETRRGQVSKKRNDLIRILFVEGAGELEQQIKTAARAHQAKKTR